MPKEDHKKRSELKKARNIAKSLFFQNLDFEWENRVYLIREELSSQTDALRHVDERNSAYLIKQSKMLMSHNYFFQHFHGNTALEKIDEALRYCFIHQSDPPEEKYFAGLHETLYLKGINFSALECELAISSKCTQPATTLSI